jgi:hypothetical protein
MSEFIRSKNRQSTVRNGCNEIERVVGGDMRHSLKNIGESLPERQAFPHIGGQARRKKVNQNES